MSLRSKVEFSKDAKPMVQMLLFCLPVTSVYSLAPTIYIIYGGFRINQLGLTL